MRLSRAVAVAFLLPAVVLAQSAAPQPSIQRVEKGLSPPVLVEGDTTWTIEERMKLYNVPGLSVAVIQDFKVVWAKGYGVKDLGTKEPVTEHTLFQAGSISKPVAATVAMKKVEQGKLRLDEDVNLTLKSWKLPENDLTARHKVTLGNLLSHTAGLTVHGFPGYEAGAKLPTLPQVLDGAAPANTAAVRVDLEPGTKFRYSGGGTTIAQLMVQDVEGRPFDAVAKEVVLDPIGMTDSTYSQPLPEAVRAKAASGYRRDGSPVAGKYHTYPEMAAAGLWTTATDLAKFGIETQLSLAGRSNRVLKRETVERMLTPFLPDGPTGLGFFIEPHGAATYFGHNGADEGFTAMLLVHKEKGYGAALMINSDSFALMPEVLRSIAREYRWEGWDPPVKPIAVDAAALGAYAGRYKTGPDDALTITIEGGRLYARQLLGEPVELVPVADATFVRRDQETRYTFGRSSSGEVEAVSLRDPGGERRAVLMTKDDLTPLERLVAGQTAEAIEAYRKLKRESPNDELVSEGRINALGYRLMQMRKVADALALFKLNVELYPQAWNAYDSLAEAYMESGNKEEAVRNYKRSIELNPDNRNAVEQLKRLQP